MGRDLPVSAQLPNKNYYQTTHVVYDLQGIPTYQDRPIKMQRLADDYQVSHVGYDLSGDPIYMDNGSETGQYDDSLPVDDVDSGYPA